MGHVDHKHPIALNINGGSRHYIVRSGLAERLPRDVALSLVPAEGMRLVLGDDVVQVPVPTHIVAYVTTSSLMGCVVQVLCLIPDVAEFFNFLFSDSHTF